MELRTYGLALTLDFSPPNEEDWLACHVTVEVPGFSGMYTCWVWRWDLESLHQQLAHMKQQVGQPCAAHLKTTEPGIDLHLSMNRVGQIEGRYALQNFDSPGRPTLSGGFQMDQSYLPSLLAEMVKLLQVRDEE